MSEQTASSKFKWPNVSEPLLRKCAKRACERFGSSVVFNSACFSNAWCEMTGRKQVLDGSLVRAMLCGRNWLWRDEKSGCHWSMLDE